MITLSDAASEIRGLTVRQWWAGLLAARFKPTECRTWSTNYRGPVLIHSASGRPEPAPLRPDSGEYEVPEHLRALGRVLALATLTDCHFDQGCCRPWGGPGLYHWTLTDVRALPEPIPAKGRLGLWRPAPGLVGEAVAQLEIEAVHERFRSSAEIHAGVRDEDLLLAAPCPLPVGLLAHSSGFAASGGAS